LQGVEVDLDKAPPLGIPGGPLKVVQERPDVVPGDAAAVCNGLMQCPEMLLQELDPGIVDGWPTAVPSVIRNAVLGDHDLGRPILLSNPGKRVVEPTRIDLLPACGRGRMGLERLPLIVDHDG
jgi:hypothetical protein